MECPKGRLIQFLTDVGFDDGWIFTDGSGRSAGDWLALVEDNNAVAQFHHHHKIMLDQENPHAKLLHELAQEFLES